MRLDRIRQKSEFDPIRSSPIQIRYRTYQIWYKSDTNQIRHDPIRSDPDQIPIRLVPIPIWYYQIWSRSDADVITSYQSRSRPDQIKSRSDFHMIRFRSDTESIKSSKTKASAHAQPQVEQYQMRKLIKYRKWIQFFRLWDLTFTNSLQSFDATYCIHFIHFTQNTKSHLRHPNPSTDLLTDHLNQMTSLKWMKWIQYSEQCNIAQSCFDTKPT
jgi:hypothetical protein